MCPDRPALSEVCDPNRQRAEIEAEKRPADIGAARALRHEDTEHRDPSGDREILSPLARRYPGARKKRDREDDAEGRGIEEMFLTKLENRLRGDRDGSRNRMSEKIVGAEQQREAEAGDNRATIRARLRRIEAPASALHQQAGGEGQEDLRGTDAE